MSTNYVKDVMESMGWTNGAYLPVANDVNQKLMEEINALSKERAQKETDLRFIEERTTNLNEHFENANAGINHNLKLLIAFRTQTSDEQHLLKVALRQKSKITQDLEKLLKEIEEYNNYEKATEKEINRFNCNIEKLTNKIEWAKLCLDEWHDAMNKGDETNKLIEKYCKEDEAKAFAMENRRRLLQDSINKQKKILIEIFQEKKTVEKALDRTAELYRQNHAERRNLVNTWKDAVNHMNQREDEIQQAEIDIRLGNNLLDDKQMLLHEEESFLNELINNNKEVESEIDVLNDQVSSAKKILDKIIDLIALKENEVNILRKQLHADINRVNQLRLKNRQLEQDKSDKEVQIVKIQSDYNSLNERYKKFLTKHMSAQERLLMLEEMVDTEEKAKTQLSQEMARVDGILYRSQQHLLKLKEEEIIITSENEGIFNGIGSVVKGMQGLNKLQHNSIENDYNIRFQLHSIEKRITKMQGAEISVEELTIQQEKLQQLGVKADSVKKILFNIKSQIEKLDSDMKNITSIYNKYLVEIEIMNFKIQESQLYVENSIKQIKSTTQKNQEKIVELSILKIRLNEMETQISKCDDKVYNLEKHRIQLDKAMKERMLDIKTQTDLLMLKRKHLLDEHGTLKMDLGERNIKIEASKKRYEIGLDLLGKNDDGSNITATQLKIETTQEKQLLLHEGNELNEKVLQAENEIKAMENTLCLLNYSNLSYRKTFEKLDDENPEYIEFENLQKEYCKMLQNIKEQKNHLKIRSMEINESVQRRELIEKELLEQQRIKMDNTEILMKVHKELLDQKVKIERAEREVKCSYKAVYHRPFSSNFLIVFEKDLNLREIDDRNTNSLQLIGDLIDSNLELVSEVSRLLCEKGLKIPQPKTSKSSASWRSEFSEMSFIASSKGSGSCISIATSRSSSSSMNSAGLAKTSSAASVISIDFPEEEEAGKKAKVLPKKVFSKKKK